MTTKRIDNLVARLEKGDLKTNEIFSSLPLEQWSSTAYEEPHRWDFRALLAHFVSAEERLLELAQHVAKGGEGVSSEFDFEDFNAEEQVRLKDYSPEELQVALRNARQATLTWVRSLDDRQLDQMGKHPVLGEINLETMINAIYGHQLMHMRELKGKIG